MNPAANVPSIFDMSHLAALKGAVKKDDPQALKAAAQQFEALFLQMVLKSMRDATPREGMFDSEQTRMYQSLLDQQLAQVMSAKGNVGLAAILERQFARKDGPPTEFEDGLPFDREALPIPFDRIRGGLPAAPDGAVPRAYPLDGARPVGTPAAEAASGDAARDFAARVWPDAVEAARTTGIPAHFLVAQAALETGWGRAEPRGADGRPSHNLFGIKAGRAWNGATVEAVTTEYVEGIPQRQVEKFRAYGSYAESFRDYAALLTANPRYAGVVGTQDANAFARGLQKAGYATDPAYADKLVRIIGGGTLRNALAG